jgi:hypothetical protein
MMNLKGLGRLEKGIYVLLWFLSVVSWIGAGFLWIKTGQITPYVWISGLGGIGALAFGMAVRTEQHMLPGSLLNWLERIEASNKKI